MGTPLADAAHKENVHVGGGKTTTMRKHIKLKPSGKERKALAAFRDTYAPSSGVSNDVDLKPMAHGIQQIAGADLFTTKNQIVNIASKIPSLYANSVSLGILKRWIKPWGHGFSDEEIKQFYERAMKGIEGMDCKFCSKEAEEETFYKNQTLSEAEKETFYKNQTLSEAFRSAIDSMIAELELPVLSGGEGYRTDDPELLRLLSLSGPIYLPEELDGTLYELDELPITELILEDDFDLDNDNIIGGKTTTGNERKAPADFRDTYASSSGVSNDVDLKPMAHGKQQIAVADPLTTNLKADLVSFDEYKKMSINYYPNLLSDEEIKQCYEWEKEGIEPLL